MTPAEPSDQAFWDAAHTRHERLIDAQRGLVELPMRMASIRDAVTSCTAREGAWHLARLLRGALAGKTPHIDALRACAFWLISEQRAEHTALFRDLFLAAARDERPEVMNLLRDPPPHRALPPESRLPQVRLPIARPVPLGERRSMARGSDRRFIERLLMDPSPLVIEKLLANPVVRPDDVVLVASRRPTLPTILMTVADQTRWLHHGIVREALTRNPYAPTGLALKLLPTLHIREVRQIALAGDLHPLVGEFARLIVALRQNLLGSLA